MIRTHNYTERLRILLRCVGVFRVNLNGTVPRQVPVRNEPGADVAVRLGADPPQAALGSATTEWAWPTQRLSCRFSSALKNRERYRLAKSGKRPKQVSPVAPSTSTKCPSRTWHPLAEGTGSYARSPPWQADDTLTSSTGTILGPCSPRTGGHFGPSPERYNVNAGAVHSG